MKPKRTKFAGRFAAVVVYALLSAVFTYAQVTEDPLPGVPASPGLSKSLLNELREQQTIDVRESRHFRARLEIVYPMNAVAFGMLPETREPGANWQAPPPRVVKKRSTTRKILGGIAGGVGGFYAGFFIGVAIEGGRDAIAGPMIGAPVGAVAGSILGYKFLF